MTNEIQGQLSINEDKLLRRRYTLTLVDECTRTGLGGEGFRARFENQLYELLAELTRQYTCCESDSVESTTAARLLRSALYNCDLALMKLPVKAAAKRLTETRLAEIHYEGLGINRELVYRARKKLEALKKSRIKVDSIHYNMALNQNIEARILNYNFHLNAGEMICNGIEYFIPTLGKPLPGISGMIALLAELEREQNFVNSFPPEQLEQLWKLYEHQLMSADANSIPLGELCYRHALLSLVACGRVEIPLSNDNAELLLNMNPGRLYYDALTVSHKLNKLAPEDYLDRLFARFRANCRGTLHSYNELIGV